MIMAIASNIMRYMNDEKVSLILKFRNMRTEDFVEDYLGIKLMWWQKLYIRMMTNIGKDTCCLSKYMKG